MSWQRQVVGLEQQYQIPQGLLHQLIMAESGGNPNARSPAGAVGYGQLIPSTAASLGVNINNPQDNLRGSAMYLSQQLREFGGNVSYALAAYNAGPGAVKQAGGVPNYTETKNYVARILGNWDGKGAAAGSYDAPDKAGAKPVRAVIKGSGTNGINRLQQAYSDAPGLGGILTSNRMKAQGKNDRKFNRQTNAWKQKDANYNAYQSSAFDPNNATSSYDPNVNNNLGKFVKTPNGLIRTRKAGEYGYQFLQRVGNNGFGLRNDAGIGQTYGGSHTAGSAHYSRDAVDWGNAKNTDDQLQGFYNWMSPRMQKFGMSELLYNSPGHYDHLHAGY